MDHFQIIYQQRAADYHGLIAAEDARSNLPAALKAVTPFQGKKVVDIGTGTGRIPLIFNNEAARIVALDTQRAMLVENQIQREERAGSWQILQADARSLPLPNGWADLSTAGWTFGHMLSWYAQSWKMEVSQALQEMIRITRPGGFIIVIETLGSRVPRAPSLQLSEYYNWLEDEWDFRSQEVRTDYQFSSVEEAVEKTEFFFGSELALAIQENQWTRLPEWTGIWYWQKPRHP